MALTAFFMSTLQYSAQVSSVQHVGRQKSRNDRLVTPDLRRIRSNGCWTRERAKGVAARWKESADRMHVEKTSCAAAAALKG